MHVTPANAFTTIIQAATTNALATAALASVTFPLNFEVSSSTGEDGRMHMVATWIGAEIMLSQQPDGTWEAYGTSHNGPIGTGCGPVEAHQAALATLEGWYRR